MHLRCFSCADHKNIQVSKMCRKKTRDFLNCCPFNLALTWVTATFGYAVWACLETRQSWVQLYANQQQLDGATTNGTEVSGGCDPSPMGQSRGVKVFVILWKSDFTVQFISEHRNILKWRENIAEVQFSQCLIYVLIIVHIVHDMIMMHFELLQFIYEQFPLHIDF